MHPSKTFFLTFNKNIIYQHAIAFLNSRHVDLLILFVNDFAVLQVSRLFTAQHCLQETIKTLNDKVNELTMKQLGIFINNMILHSD